MEYVKTVLPWTPLIVSTFYSAGMSVLSPEDKTYMLFGLVCLFAVWICTKKWGGDASIATRLEDVNKKLMTENEGLKDNLVKVYTMVQSQSRNTAQRGPPPPQTPMGQTPQMGHPPAPPAQIQANHSSQPPGNTAAEDNDGKPYL